MATRLFALISGILYLVLGVLCLIPMCLWRPERAQLRMNAIHLHGGYLAGFIAENLPHNILWMLIGAVGISASARYPWAKQFNRGLFVLSVLLTLVGLLPLGIGQLWGYLPLFGWNVLIHAITAILAWYYGFVYTRANELGIPS